MKAARCFLSVLLFLPMVMISQGQTFTTVCTYRLDYQVDSANPANKKSEDMLLLLNNDSSVFMSKGNFIQDSVLSQVHTPADAVKKIWADNVTGFKFIITKDGGKELSVEDYIPSIYYRYKEPRSDLAWEIAGDTGTVNGFHCQKATVNFGGRKWTAWFIPDIAAATVLTNSADYRA